MSKSLCFLEKQSCLSSLLWDCCISGGQQQWCRNLISFLLAVRSRDCGTSVFFEFIFQSDDFLILEVFPKTSQETDSLLCGFLAESGNA